MFLFKKTDSFRGVLGEAAEQTKKEKRQKLMAMSTNKWTTNR